MILTDEAFLDFRQSKSLGMGMPPEEVEYSTDGLAMATTQNSTLRLYSSLSGDVQNIIYLPGIQKHKFMYPSTLVHTASSMLHLLSVFDSKYIRVFSGHRSQINALSTCPREDSILSSSGDCTSYWDVRKRNPVYRINVSGSIGCLSSSTDYAILVNGSLLKVYDKRNSRGPRTTTALPEKRYKEIFYSPDASFIVASGEKGHLLLAPDGGITGSIALEKAGSGCITPDSTYFLCCEGSSVLAYHVRTKKKLHTFETPGFESTKVRFNPCFAQFASASSLLNIWAIGENPNSVE